MIFQSLENHKHTVEIWPSNKTMFPEENKTSWKVKVKARFSLAGGDGGRGIDMVSDMTKQRGK